MPSNACVRFVARAAARRCSGTRSRRRRCRTASRGARSPAGRPTAPRCRTCSAAPAPGSAGSNRRCGGPSRGSRRPRATAADCTTTRAGSKNSWHAEAVAGGAGAGRAVEREQPRLELGDAVAADRAGVAVREHDRLPLGLVVRTPDARDALRESRAPSRTIRRGAARRRARTLQAVDHGLDRVLASSDRASALRRVRPAVPSMRARTKPWPRSCVEHLGVLALAVAAPSARAAGTPVPSGSASTWSTIWLTVCAARSMP